MAIIKKTSYIWTELLSAIEHAETEILFQTFYIDNDTAWKTFTTALIKKAQAGVTVRCLFDALGSRGCSNTLAEKEMRDAGIKIIYFNWLTPWSPKNKALWFFRNHKRSLIIDKKILHIGGWCIGDRVTDWLDANIETEDENTVQDALVDFENMYTFAHRAGIKIHGEKRFLFTPEDMQGYGYQAPLLKSRYLVYNYLTLIKNASKNINLVVPYFVPTHKFTRALIRARRRGVAVSIFLPKQTDHHIVDIAAQTYFEKFLQYGIHIYQSDMMIHAKVSTFDDAVYIGSMNLDPGSIRFNFENGIFTKNPVIVNELYADITTLKQNCSQVTFEEWLNRSVWRVWLEKFVRLFRGVL